MTIWELSQRKHYISIVAWSRHEVAKRSQSVNTKDIPDD
jgi:hypothetical protein